MPRARRSVTADADLLAAAREQRPGVADSALVDEALRAVTAFPAHPDQIDAAYAAYDAHPLTEADAWGVLASYRSSAGAS